MGSSMLSHSLGLRSRGNEIQVSATRSAAAFAPNNVGSWSRLTWVYAENASERGIEVIIAGAGGAAHLPGMTAAKTHLPVIGVPVKTRSLEGKDSLLSIVQMPAGIPVATVAIGKAGSINAGLLAASILSIKYPNINKKILAYRKKQTQRVLKSAKLI